MRERERERETDTEREKEKERGKEGERDREGDPEREREIETATEKAREGERERESDRERVPMMRHFCIILHLSELKQGSRMSTTRPAFTADGCGVPVRGKNNGRYLSNALTSTSLDLIASKPCR